MLNVSNNKTQERVVDKKDWFSVSKDNSVNDYRDKNVF